MITEKTFYDATFDSLTDKSDIPVRILMEEIDNPKSNLIDFMFENKGREQEALMLVCGTGHATVGEDLIDETDNVYKFIFITTEGKRKTRNNNSRLVTLYHELGHCCDDRTLKGLDLYDEIYKNTRCKTKEEVVAFLDRLESLGLESEYFADEFAAKYVGCRESVKFLRVAIEQQQFLYEYFNEKTKGKTEMTLEETLQPLKDRINNLFIKRHELRMMKQDKLPITLEDIVARNKNAAGQEG